ncbi:MAG: hypothetical protein AB7P03_05110 [Kofleriaceae bacterium]
MRRVLLAVMLGLSTLGVVHADPTSDAMSKVDQLFKQGRELMRAGDYPAACERFSEALAIEWAPGTAANYGDCLARLGKIRKAVTILYEAARAYERENDPRARDIRALADATERKLAKIEISIRDPSLEGLKVTVGNEEITVSRRIVERVDPGTIVISATAPKHTAFRATVEAGEGEIVAVQIPGLAAEATRGQPERGSPDRVRWAIGTAIAGGGLLVVTGVLGYLANHKYDRASDDHCMRTDGHLVCEAQGKEAIASAGRYADLATGAGIVGAGLVVTGVVLYITAPRVTVSPVTSADAIGLSIRGRF